MKTTQLPRRMKALHHKIEELERKDSHFKKICNEYQKMNSALWEFENSQDIFVTDEFINSLKEQTYLLEDEIQELLNYNKTQQ